MICNYSRHQNVWGDVNRHKSTTIPASQLHVSVFLLPARDCVLAAASPGRRMTGDQTAQTGNMTNNMSPHLHALGSTNKWFDMINLALISSFVHYLKLLLGFFAHFQLLPGSISFVLEALTILVSLSQLHLMALGVLSWRRTLHLQSSKIFAQLSLSLQLHHTNTTSDDALFTSLSIEFKPNPTNTAAKKIKLQSPTLSRWVCCICSSSRATLASRLCLAFSAVFNRNVSFDISSICSFSCILVPSSALQHKKAFYTNHDKNKTTTIS